MITPGVLGDTHVPDRARQLHPEIMPCFREAGVQAILHAGDISTQPVLTALGTIAPVHAVRGNRDWLLRHLPLSLELNLDGIKIALTHGHGGMMQYLRDKPRWLFYTYKHERLVPRLLAAFPAADVIVFGHGHLPLNQQTGRQLLFNPGTPLYQRRRNLAPSIGLLRLFAGGQVEGQIVELD